MSSPVYVNHKTVIAFVCRNNWALGNKIAANFVVGSVHVSHKVNPNDGNVEERPPETTIGLYLCSSIR